MKGKNHGSQEFPFSICSFLLSSTRFLHSSRSCLVFPLHVPPSLADAHPFCYPALLAHHVAAPVELAVAALAARLLQDVVASAAAQTLAVVHAGARLVADPALRAGRVRAQVPLAEIRRFFEVDQLIDAGPPSVVRVVVVMVVVVVVLVVMVVVVVVGVVVVGVVVVAGVVVGVIQLPRVAVVGLDECGDLEALFKDGAHQAKLGRHLPARLQLAAARRPVALAFPSHVVEHHLERRHILAKFG